MADISTQKLLYHFTNIKNLDSIFANGILPRSEIENFADVADHEILDSRKKLKLENYVPFHFLRVVHLMVGYRWITRLKVLCFWRCGELLHKPITGK